jgi:biopolymer transport protein ExbD
MKFPRNARIFRGQLDAAPFAIVFFLLVIFLLLGSLLYTPGVRVQLPVADDLPGTDKPTISVAIDKNGRLYFENQWIEENELKERLRQAVAQAREPLALVVQADEAVPNKILIQLSMLARQAGIAEAWLATLPRAVAAPPQRGAR